MPVMVRKFFERSISELETAEMLGVLFIAVIAALALTSGEVSNWHGFLLNRTAVERPSGRFFPLFSIVRFANYECAGSNLFNGTCFTRKECSNYGGSAAGSCANKLGVCCTFRRECGTTTSLNNTYFVNPGYHSSYRGGERCTITVNRCNTNICQLRLDFEDFSLSQPNAAGLCDNDFLLVSGGASIVPRICGENADQHVYVDFNGANPITLSVDTNTDYSFIRKWNIRIQQIACDATWRAPNGCLQYYSPISGTVSSFNYGTTTNPRVVSSTLPLPGTRQMQYLRYGVCVRMAPGYCNIEWSQVDSMSFLISGDPSVLDPTIALSGESCDHNYVTIPCTSINGTLSSDDRFCGNSFTTKTSICKPFTLYVVTNPDPGASAAVDVPTERDIDNRGFILKYRQLPCAV